MLQAFVSLVLLLIIMVRRWQSLGVPVGLIVTSWGGSACEAWINGNLIKSDWLKRHSLKPYTLE